LAGGKGLYPKNVVLTAIWVLAHFW
jgi:hypothetical protein